MSSRSRRSRNPRGRSSTSKGKGAAKPASGRIPQVSRPGQPKKPAAQPAAPAAAARDKPSPRAPAKAGGRDLRLAILTGVTLAALVIGLLYLGSEAFFGLAVLIIMLAQAEFYRAARTAGHNPAAGLGLVAGAVLLAGVFVQGEAAAGIVLSATLAASFLWYLPSQGRADLVTNVAVTVLGVGYIPLLGSFIGLLAIRPDGRGVVVVAIGAAAVYDIFAYAGGSKLGRHKMTPSISPNKTWEGAAVATIATVVAMALLAPRLGPWSVVQAAVLGVALSVVAPLGDLVESAIKRDIGIKDMGTLLPGHGGALDRIDAMLFTAPTVYLSLKLFGL